MILNDIYTKIDDHKRNAHILRIIYISGNIISIMLSTITALLLGSKSINDIRDSVSLIAFICNVIATIIVSIVNWLKIETKIENHKKTAKNLEDLTIDYTKELQDPNINIEDICKEKYKTINDDAEALCF